MKHQLIAALAVTAALALPAQAGDIVDEWASMKAPAAPTLKPVTVDPKTTALLMLDFMNQNCGKRPRCVATIPAMKKLLTDARAAKATVVYSIIANSTPADVIKDVAPLADEPHVLSGPDKFRKTDLEKILKDKGIKTVIAVGTASNGAVLYTASGAALRHGRRHPR
jgi:nicotinamidase-related amidase